MNLARRFRRAVLVLSALSVFTYAVADENAALALLVLPLIFVNYVLYEVRGATALPRWAVYAALTLAIGRAALDTWANGLSVSGFSAFLVSMLVVKLYDRRTARDYAQILTLIVFLAVGSILTSAALLPGLLLLVSVPLVLSAVMQFQIYAGHEKAEQSSGRPALERTTSAPPAGRRPWVHLRMLQTAALLAGLAISAGVFVVMPRGLGESFFGAAQDARGRRVTGFADRVQLGQPGLISESRAGVMDATFTDASGENLGSEGRVFYLRGAVLDEYRAGSWTSQSATMTDRGQGTARLLPGDPPGQVVLQSITLRGQPGTVQPLFALLRPVEVTLDGPGSVRADAATGAFVRQGAAGGLRYEVRSVLPAFVATGEGEGEARRRQPVRFENPRVLEVAQTILRDAGVEPDPALRPREEDGRAARALESWLQRTFTYTLNIPVAPVGQDPTEWFLLEGRTGHCEYFASALTAMLRSVGVPARVVTGFVAAEFDRPSGAYVVRQNNAHAWVEVELAPGLWQTYDATPAADFTAIHQPRRTLLSGVWRWLDEVEAAWGSVVGFDEQQRRSLLGGRRADADAVAGWMTRARERLRAGEWSLPFTRRDLGEGAGLAQRVLAAVAPALFVAVVVLGLAWLLRRLGAMLALRTRTVDRGPELPRFYTQTLALLRDAGVPKPESVPPLLHLRRAGAALRERAGPEGAQAAERLVRALYLSHFAGQSQGAEGERQVQADLETLRRAVGGSTSRRATGR